MLLRPGCGGWPNCPGCIVSNMFTVHLGKNMVSGGCLILRGDFNWLVVVFLNIVIDMIRNHLLFWGWVGNINRLSTHQQLKLADDTHVHRLLLPTFSSGFDASSEIYGRGALSGNRKGSFWRLAFRIQAASPKRIILMAHALLDAQCQGAYLRSTGRASRLED